MDLEVENKKFRCDCHTGYEYNNDTEICVDIDECSKGLHHCGSFTDQGVSNLNWVCVNKDGNYDCMCPFHHGYYKIQMGYHSKCIKGNYFHE